MKYKKNVRLLHTKIKLISYNSSVGFSADCACFNFRCFETFFLFCYCLFLKMKMYDTSINIIRNHGTIQQVHHKTIHWLILYVRTTKEVHSSVNCCGPRTFVTITYFLFPSSSSDHIDQTQRSSSSSSSWQIAQIAHSLCSTNHTNDFPHCKHIAARQLCKPARTPIKIAQKWCSFIRLVDHFSSLPPPPTVRKSFQLH